MESWEFTNDQVNGGRSTRWEKGAKPFADQVFLPEMDHWQGRVHKLLVGTAALFSMVQSQKAYATDVKPAKTRRNAKPDDCATPLEIHNHLSAAPQGRLTRQTRPDLSCQISLAHWCMPSPTVVQVWRANA